MSEKTAKLFDLHPWEQILSLNIRPASLQQLLDLAFGKDFHVGEEKSGFQEIAVLVDFADGGIDAEAGIDVDREKHEEGELVFLDFELLDFDVRLLQLESKLPFHDLLLQVAEWLPLTGGEESEKSQFLLQSAQS